MLEKFTEKIEMNKDIEKTDEDTNDDIYETVRFNKGRATKVHEINIEKKKILKE